MVPNVKRARRPTPTGTPKLAQHCRVREITTYLELDRLDESFFRSPEAHHRDRHVERGDRRPERNVVVRLDELDVALLLRYRPLALDVRPAVDPRGPQQQTDAPGRTDHDRGPGRRPLRPVGERARHAEVPIEADDQQVEYGRVRREIIERQPGVADVRSERPVPEQRRDGEQRHRDEPDREVGDREREQKVVADRLQLLVDLERDHHHDVAGDGQDAQHGRDDAEDDDLREGVGSDSSTMTSSVPLAVGSESDAVALKNSSSRAITVVVVAVVVAAPVVVVAVRIDVSVV
uniref:Uncharacterized protein n=1 Tax=Anopheles farauti TaxID=69004 RepID=A0A182Q4T2_9DIPT